MAHEYPDTFARFYDLIYHQIRDTADSEFYLSEILKTKGKVLEVGTGTGRFFTAALRRGADIYGLDISPSMIRVLLKGLDDKDHHRISQQSIVDFNLDQKFDLIIAPFRVFMHLLSKEDQAGALNNVFRHLNPGGKFIFDVFVPDMRALLEGITNQVDFDGEYEPGKRVKRTVSTKPDLLNQLINIDFMLEWDDETGRRQEHWLTPLRYFFRFELEHLVERSSFKSYTILGDFDGNELSEKSIEFITVCRK